MKVDIKELDGNLVAELTGRLDTVSSAQCAEDLKALFDNATKNMVLDCKNLDYISSSGLRLFLSLRKASSAKKLGLTLTNLDEEVYNVFKITGFVNLFDIK